MPYPTTDGFRALLRSANHKEIVQSHIFGGTPFAFRDSPADYDALVTHLCERLEVERDGITMVGSGRIGFSLDPDLSNFGKPFRSESDLDIVVVSDMLFDTIWLELLSISRRRWSGLAWRDRDAIKGHAQEIYWGRIWPHKLLAVSRLAKRWVSAFRSLSQNPRLAFHETKGRLYRTWNHAEIYHLYGLSELALNLARQDESKHHPGTPNEI